MALSKKKHERENNTQRGSTNRRSSTRKGSKWKRTAMHKGWDFALAAIFLVASIFFLYLIYKAAVLSWSWMWKVMALIIAVNLLLFLLIFIKRMPAWLTWVRRVLIILLSGLMVFASFSINTFLGALEAITQPETATTVNISLITKKDGGAHTLSQLDGKKIGIQTANDNINSTYVKEQLAKETDVKNVTYVEGLDYSTLYKQLQDGEIDALIITDYYYKTLLKETYPTIEDDIFVLKSYQKTKESTTSASTKDIRYEPFTVYIAGVDEGDDPSINGRSDVNIILIVNPLANHIEMVSIPRDAYIPNPALHYGNDKLTHLGLNGVENSMEGLEEIVGFDIDFYAKLNFFSVIDIIDAIGQIEVNVPASFCEQDEYRSFAEEDLICLNEGVQKVNGKQALALSRHRKTYGDVMRGQAQQEVIRGIINTLTTPAGAAKINDIMKIAPKSVSTNLPMEQITNFISAQLDNLKPWTIDSIVLNNSQSIMLETASMPGQNLSCMLLSKVDIQGVFDAYQQMINQMQFNTFSFDLDNLEKGNTQLPVNPKVLWVGSDTSSSRVDDNTPAEDPDETYVPPVETPIPDPTPTPPTPDPKPDPKPNPDPVEPEEPTDPEKPVEPEEPVKPDVPDNNPDEGSGGAETTPQQ